MKIHPIPESSTIANGPLIHLGSIQTRRIKHMEIQQRMQEYERTHYPEIIKLQFRMIRQLEKENQRLWKRLKQR